MSVKSDERVESLLQAAVVAEMLVTGKPQEDTKVVFLTKDAYAEVREVLMANARFSPTVVDEDWQPMLFWRNTMIRKKGD